MAKAHGHLGVRLPDGSVGCRAKQLPDGSWGMLSNVDSPPCCCGGDPGGGCDNGCGTTCTGPGCQYVPDARGIECIRADFIGLQNIELCEPFPGSVFYTTREIIAFPQHVVLTGFRIYNAAIPVLIHEKTIRRSTGEIIEQRVVTSVDINATVGHCTVLGSETYCPMVGSIRIHDLNAGIGLVFSDNTDLYMGVSHDNTTPLGCNDNGTNQTIIDHIIFSIPTACDNPPATYYARKCGGTQRITVDISQRPDSDNQINVRYQGEVYVILNEQSDEQPVPVTWVSTECQEWPIAQLCGGDSRVTFDPDLRPPDGVTFLVFGLRFKPNGEYGENAPSPGTWTPDQCPGDEPTDTTNVDVGDPSDADNVNLIDPRAQQRFEGQTDYGVNQPGRCQGCGQ